MRELKESAYLYEDIENTILKQRIMNSLNWTIKKAVIYKRCYYICAWVGIISPLIAAVLNSLDNSAFTKLNIQTYSVVLAAITTISSALISLYHFKERWKAHRKVAERLKSELVKFHMRSGIYKEGNIKTLSDRIEVLITEDYIVEMKIMDNELDKK